MGIGSAIAAVALAVSAASTYKQHQAAQDAADAEKEAQDIQEAQGTNRQNQQRRQQVREERIRRARILQASENTGVGGSSSQVGSVGSLATQTGANLAAGRADAAAARGVSQANQSVLDARTQGSLWSGVGQISGSVFGAAGGFNNFTGTSGAGQGQAPQGGWQSQLFTIEGSNR